MSEVLGVVKFYNPEKGFGFIAPETGDAADCFFGSSSFAGEPIVINKGDVVAFVRVENDRKPGRFRAVDVRLVRRANGTPG